MEPVKDEVCVYSSRRKINKDRVYEFICRLIMFGIIFAIWTLASKHYSNDLLLPSPVKVIKAFVASVTSIEVIKNLLLTLKRVLTGFSYAMVIGVPLGFLMGYFKIAERLVGGFIDSIRQVPIMAWVPLTIVWFGIGDGPTIFLIAFSGVFPVILNTIEGVRNISKDYYNAARSMGAGRWSIFAHIIVPATIPDILIGARIAISSGWMSVI